MNILSKYCRINIGTKLKHLNKVVKSDLKNLRDVLKTNITYLLSTRGNFFL